MKRLVPIALAALVLSGCAQQDSPQEPATTPTPVTSSIPAPSSATPTPSPSSTPTSEVVVAPPAHVDQPPAQDAPAYEAPAAPVQPALPGGATFDPNSADGYGPNQPLPPLCVRFPNDFDCNGNPLPKAPAPKKQYPMNPNGTVNEGDITANFWKCKQAGGSDAACRQ